MYVKNESTISKIQPQYHDLLDYVQSESAKLFVGEQFSLFLLGSVGRGDAIASSDIDLEIVVNAKTDETKAIIAKLHEQLSALFPAHAVVSLGLAQLSDIKASSLEQFIYSTDGILLNGVPLVFNIPMPPIGLDLARLMNQNFAQMRNQRQRDLEFEDTRIDAIHGRGKWLAKVGLRLALGLIMTRNNSYTHNINEIALLCSGEKDISEMAGKLFEYYLNPPKSQAQYQIVSSVVDEIAVIARAESVLI